MEETLMQTKLESCVSSHYIANHTETNLRKYPSSIQILLSNTGKKKVWTNISIVSLPLLVTVDAAVSQCERGNCAHPPRTRAAIFH